MSTATVPDIQTNPCEYVNWLQECLECFPDVERLELIRCRRHYFVDRLRTAHRRLEARRAAWQLLGFPEMAELTQCAIDTTAELIAQIVEA